MEDSAKPADLLGILEAIHIVVVTFEAQILLAMVDKAGMVGLMSLVAGQTVSTMDIFATAVDGG